MKFLGFISLFGVFTIHLFIISKTGNVTSMLIEDGNKNASRINCSLNFTLEKEHRLFDITIKNNRLIRLLINLTWTDIPQNASRNNIDITKSKWFLATEDAGKDLLLLDDQFEVMSLGTLAISVGEFALTINQIPENCLAEISEHQAIETISGFLLKAVPPEHVNDENYKPDEAYSKHVCNGTITGSGICCLSNDEDIITCTKLVQNEWTVHFENFVLILSLFIYGHSIRLIPNSLYHDRYVEMRDVQTPIKLNIEMTGQPTQRRLVKIAGKDNYKKSKGYIKRFSRNCKQVAIKAVYLFLDEGRFESQASNTSALTNVFHDCVQMFKDISCKCNKDYSDFEGLKECCYYDLIRLCYNILIKITIVLLVFSPLAIRLVFLINFMNLDTNLKTDFQWSCFSIIYCFSVIILAFLIFSIRRFRKFKSMYKAKLQRSMKGAMDYNISTGLEHAGEMIKTFFRSCNDICYLYRFSRLSLAKAWLTHIFITFPFSIILLCLQIVRALCPIVNFCSLYLIELLDSFRYLHREFQVKPLRCITMITTSAFVLFYLSVASALGNVFNDVSTFFAKCFLYIAIGCLLNFDNLLVYFSFCVLILTYIVRCIRRVNSKIRKFNKEIIKVLSRILVECQYTLNGSIVIKRDGLFFSTRHLLYFFKRSHHDKMKYLYVSRSFLNYLSSIPSPLTPGSRNWLYAKAFMEIIFMFLLLALVLVIVVSYGNATDLSSGMKTLITLGSGALLFLFNIILIRSFSHSTYEDNELLENFARNHVEDLEDDFKEIWEIHDFENFSADNTESNADLYCKYKSEHEIKFFTKESLLTTGNGKPISVRDICCATCCEIFDEMYKHDINLITNEFHSDMERF